MMPDDTTTGDGTDLPGISRRTLLRSGAAAAGGAALLPGVASAHECPRSPGYWSGHEWPDTIPDPFGIGGVTMSVADWQAFLLAPPGGDKADIVARHLVATVVNFQFRPALPEGDPGCVDEPLPEFGGKTVREIRLAAERWLDASSFDDPGTRQDSWLAGGVDGEPLKDALDAFNNDRLGLSCDCDGVESDDGRVGTGSGGSGVDADTRGMEGSSSSSETGGPPEGAGGDGRGPP